VRCLPHASLGTRAIAARPDHSRRGLYTALFSEAGMRFSFSFALSLMMWLAVLIYWLESFMARMEGMQPMVLPLAAAVHGLARVSSQRTLGRPRQRHRLQAALSCRHAGLQPADAVRAARHFHGLYRKRPAQALIKRSLNSLPPLLTMESCLFRMLLVGFILLTLTVGSGVFFSEALFGKPLTIDHKTLFAFASWGIFATLLIGRHAWGWRGKRALRWTLAGFALLILAYVGSRFVAEVILGRV
jgi:ABC-type uncharacterized transport system permease subunit